MIATAPGFLAESHQIWDFELAEVTRTYACPGVVASKGRGQEAVFWERLPSVNVGYVDFVEEVWYVDFALTDGVESGEGLEGNVVFLHGDVGGENEVARKVTAHSHDSIEDSEDFAVVLDAEVFPEEAVSLLDLVGHSSCEKCERVDDIGAEKVEGA